MSNEKPMSAAAGKVVQVHYALKSDDGEQIESSFGGEPLTYLHGAENIIPGLETAISGHVAGDRVATTVAPADGYGERNRPGPEAVPRAAFPAELDIQPGMRFVTDAPDGTPIPVWVADVEDETVHIDFNHPLAGETLNFDVEVVSVRDATEEELQHGHPHGPEGHHHH